MVLSKLLCHMRLNHMESHLDTRALLAMTLTLDLSLFWSILHTAVRVIFP